MHLTLEQFFKSNSRGWLAFKFNSINQGTINGVNQFHSLQTLNVGLPAGALPGAVPDIASFDGPAGIQNILTRVTGGDISQIDGRLR